MTTPTVKQTLPSHLSYNPVNPNQSFLGKTWTNVESCCVPSHSEGSSEHKYKMPQWGQPYMRRYYCNKFMMVLSQKFQFHFQNFLQSQLVPGTKFLLDAWEHFWNFLQPLRIIRSRGLVGSLIKQGDGEWGEEECFALLFFFNEEPLNGWLLYCLKLPSGKIV